MRIPVVELPDITICEEESNQAKGLNCRDKQIEDKVKFARRLSFKSAVLTPQNLQHFKGRTIAERFANLAHPTPQSLFSVAERISVGQVFFGYFLL